MVHELVLVRHGESLGNVAREAAEASGAETIELGGRDADVQLSDAGQAQADAVGRWLADNGGGTFDAVLSSPFVRAHDTARRALRAAGWDLTPELDERLRDRELGILDQLTFAGVRARYPAEAARRRELGKFYYRPPGGESWTDVALRLRSILRDIDAISGRALVFTHDAVVMIVRYLTQRMSEADLLDLAAHESIRNAAISRFVREGDAPGSWRIAEFNSVAHLEHYGSPVTSHEAEHDVHAN